MENALSRFAERLERIAAGRRAERVKRQPPAPRRHAVAERPAGAGVVGSAAAPRSWTGSGYLDLANPDPADIRLADIARNLSRTARYNGGTIRFQSVAEHALFCDHIARDFGIGRSGRRVALMHDAAEYIVGDHSRPCKVMNPGFAPLEDRIWRAIARRFDLPGQIPAWCKLIDNIAAATEKRDLIPAAAGDWPGLPAPSNMRISEIEPDRAKIEREFLARAAELGLSDPPVEASPTKFHFPYVLFGEGGSGKTEACAAAMRAEPVHAPPAFIIRRVQTFEDIKAEVKPGRSSRPMVFDGLTSWRHALDPTEAGLRIIHVVRPADRKEPLAGVIGLPFVGTLLVNDHDKECLGRALVAIVQGDTPREVRASSFARIA